MHATLQDYESLSMESWTKKEEQYLFHIVQEPIKPLKEAGNWYVMITIEMSLD